MKKEVRYEVRVNGEYVNRFFTYTEACDTRDEFLRKFPKARVDIIPLK